MFKFERKVDYFIIVHCGSRSFYLINTMASRRKSLEEENKLRVLRLLNDNPTITSREIAEKIGISNGSSYYCVKALISKGMIKLKNFKNHKNKSKYAYILTPNGIYEKTILTAKFLNFKLKEYEDLKKEIKELEREVEYAKETINFSKKDI